MTASATSAPAAADDITVILRHQLAVLIDHGYPALAHVTAAEFTALARPLENLLERLPPPSSDRSLPLVLVVSRALVPTSAAMALVRDGRGKQGTVKMEPTEPDDFTTVPAAQLPGSPLYLLADVDLGADTLNVRPKDALPGIVAAGRLPLTIDEGVAVLTQFPDALQTHNAFQLLASRQSSQRIPSIWVSYGQPRLGWCWDGAPHPWMGSASAAVRIGLD